MQCEVIPAGPVPAPILAAGAPFPILDWLVLHTPGAPIAETHVRPVAMGDNTMLALRDASMYRTTYLVFEYDAELTEIMEDIGLFSHAVPGEHGGC